MPHPEVVTGELEVVPNTKKVVPNRTEVVTRTSEVVPWFLIMHRKQTIAVRPHYSTQIFLIFEFT